jgi:hypothetical protein
MSTRGLVADDPRNHQVAEPLVVRRDDVPRRKLGAGVVDHAFISALVIGPQRAFGVVALADFPLPILVFQPHAEAFELLFGADVEEELEHARALFGQQFLELVDLVVALLPRALVDIAVDARDQHVFVVRSVEDRDLALARRAGVDAPQEIVAGFLGRGLFEARNRNAHRVGATKQMADHPVLAAGIGALQHDQQRSPGIGVEQVLHRIDPLEIALQEIVGFVAQARLAVLRRIDFFQSDLLARLGPELCSIHREVSRPPV